LSNTQKAEEHTVCKKGILRLTLEGLNIPLPDELNIAKGIEVHVMRPRPV
jgi:hypothetical protein